MKATLSRVTPGIIALIAQKSNSIAIITDADRKIQWVNEAFEQITGYKFHEVKGKDPKFLQGPDTDKKELAKMNRNLSLGNEVQVELLNYNKQGKPFWVDIHIMPVKNEAGDVVNFVSLEKDITAQKKYEQQLTESKYKLDAIYRSIYDYNFFISLDRKVLAFSRAAEEIVKLTIGKRVELGKDFLEYTTPAAKDTFIKNFNYVVTHKEHITKEECVDLPDGDVRWLNLSYSPVFDDAGKLLGVTLNAHDITERKRAELSLAESEAKLRAIFDNSTSAYYFVNKQGELLAFNSSASKVIFVNHNKRLTIGTDLGYYLTDEQKKHHEKALEFTIKNKQPQTYERELDNKPDKAWYRITYTPVYDKDAVFLGVSIVSDDITKFKLADKLLIDSEAKLKAIFDNSPDAKFFVDTNRIILAFNARAKQLRETYAETPEIGQPLEKYVPLSHVKQFKAHISRCINTLTEVVVNKRYPTDMGVKYFRFVFTPVFDKHNKLWGVLIKQEDNTESEMARRKIAESEYKLRAIYESTLDANMLISSAYKVIAFNNRAKDFIKSFYKKRLKEGMYILNVTEDDERNLLKRRLDEVLAKKAPVIVESKREHKSGVIAHFVFSYSPTIDRRGEVIGISINIADITARKNYERELEMKNRALSDIATMQSHGLRRPLANILGLSNLLNKQNDPDHLKDVLEMLVRSAKELDNEVHEIVNKASSNNTLKN